ncbi:hypothetical protein [Aequorivita viscosa]|uniref:Uncharacterized protein n=1 Tax=Aequorivita viscosa TaxID=797419 RepID=A0A1M6P105_9FLAO|nr:hypothetical protein [Aequorivita viscosa]SDW25551.1 hypothetical protein SAMN05216556_103178 [Aequorivita viscosa]SHK01645.1 hypothetical protein SAMN04487908_1416 [Aequorivita viscosa]
MKFIIFLLALAGLLFSCQNTTKENEKEETHHETSIVFGDSDFSFPELSAPAKQQAIQWGVFEDILAETKKLNGSNLRTLKNRSERLSEYSDSLFKKVPDTLNTNQIRSRLLVVKTRAEVLKQAAHSEILDSAALQNSVSEMNGAVKNLIVHLNEKFLKDKIDSQRLENEKMELREQQRYKDSIMNLERQDIQRRKL